MTEERKEKREQASERGKLPFALRQISAREALDRSRLAQRFPGQAGVLDLPSLGACLGRTDAALVLRGIDREPPPPHGVVPVALSTGLSPQTHRFALGIESESALALVDMVLGRRPGRSARTLTSGEEGAFIFALDRLAGDFIRSSGQKLIIRGLLCDGRQITDYLGAKPQWRMHGLLRCGPLEALLSLWTTGVPAGQLLFPRPRDLESARDWRVRLRVEIGWTRLCCREAAALGPGDIVTLDAGSHPCRPELPSKVILRCGAFSALGSFADRKTIVFRAPEGAGESSAMEEEARKTEIDVTLEPPPRAVSSPLAVDVSVEIGRLRLTVEQAVDLLPGTLLRLDRDVGGEVALMVGEKRIGSGRLVDLEGVLAVEITEGAP